MRELHGRVALITGAGRGIGLGIARELARAGAELVLVSRDPARLAQAVESIRAEGGVAHALAADVNASEWLAELDRRFPAVDVLVNNAAAFAPYAPLEKVSLQDIERVLGTTLIAALRLTRHLVGGMKARGFGRILNVGSVAGSLGGAGQVAYSTAKAGLRGLTVTVAIECARRGVTCNLLELGLVDTERVREAIAPEIRAHLQRNTPLGRMGTVEDVAHVARALVAPAAAFVTGALVPVSGGLGLGLYPEQLG